MYIVQSQNSGFRSYTLQTYLIIQKFPWIFGFKVILTLFPEQIQNSGICRTRNILRTLSIYPMTPNIFKTFTYSETVFVSYSLMYQLFFRTTNVLMYPLLFFKNMGYSLAILFSLSLQRMSYRALINALHWRYLTEFWIQFTG